MRSPRSQHTPPLRPARPSLAPHAATVHPSRSGLPSARPPLAAHKATIQRSTRDTTRTFVIGPTQIQYEKSLEKQAQNEIGKLAKMCEFDLAYFGAPDDKSVYPKVLFTGYDAPGLDTVAEECSQIEGLSWIRIVFTAHGSPGLDGRVGMGSHEFESKDKPNLRLSGKELANMILSSELAKHKDTPTIFEFRCCNSAYFPFDKFVGYDEATQKKGILEKSVIGQFYAEITSKWTKVQVLGFRGFYYPAAKKPEVETAKGTKTAAANGTVSIAGNNVVKLPDVSIFKKLKNNPDLDQWFP